MHDYDSVEPSRFAGKLPRRVRVHTTEGQPARVTPGRLDRHARRAFMLGNCLTLAILLSRETGWPILALRGRDVTASGQRFLAHAFVEHPDGWLVDVDGINDRQVTTLWQFDTDLIEISAEAAVDELVQHPDEFPPQHPVLAANFVAPVLSRVQRQIDRSVGVAAPASEAALNRY